MNESDIPEYLQKLYIMKIIKLTSEYEKAWDKYVHNHKDGTIFHTVIFRDIMHSVYGGKPLYLLVINDDLKIRGILPSFIKRSLIFGKRIISTFNFFYGGPLCYNEIVKQKIIGYIVEKANDLNIKYIELRSLNLQKLSERNMIYDKYRISILELSSKYEEVSSKFKKRFRQKLSAINKKIGSLKIKPIENIEELKLFFNILANFFKNKFKTIPQPYQILFQIYSKLVPKNMADFLIAVNRGKILAGIVLLKFKNRAQFMWGAYKNNGDIMTLLLNEAIKKYCKEGYNIFDFGSSHFSDEGLLFYKSRWGAEHLKIPFYYILLDNKAKIPDYNTTYQKFKILIKCTPTGILKISAPYLHKLLQ